MFGKLSILIWIPLKSDIVSIDEKKLTNDTDIFLATSYKDMVSLTFSSSN